MAAELEAHLAEAANGDEPIEGTSLEGLGKLWERDEVIRGKALKTGSLLSWPSPKKTGVITFETVAFNAKVVEHCLYHWCPQVPSVKTLNIDQVRAEARVSKTQSTFSKVFWGVSLDRGFGNR